ncbi:hypothetical protein WUBG_18744 [Wuchereria bancrofti]|uniref:Uncharacterized protein n=1 Tax=Wuchereria bancrofti TaxID=6293 RepID=J9DL49_WUCBA|nr:hypothetical protein WUBG_18744 [Wuchereria bancrofti]
MSKIAFFIHTRRKALVAFIRKRDPRVRAHKKELEEKRLEQERKTEENRRLKILEQLSQAKEYKESEEIRQSQLENLRERNEEIRVILICFRNILATL